MKLKLLLLTLLMGVESGFAQDVITLINGLTITAKVEEINDSSVKYRKYSNLSGPIYTLEQDKIGKITYENGEVDYFAEKPDNIDKKPSDGKPNKVDEQINTNNQTQESPYSNSDPHKTDLNEYELLRLAETGNININPLYYNKAKKYRLIGWIGGGALVLTGGIVGLALLDAYGWDSCDVPVCIGGGLGGGLVAGAIWCASWNVAAHNMMKKATLAEMYSMAVMQTDEFKIGKSSFVGSLNIMGNTFTKTNALGIGLTLNL